MSGAAAPLDLLVVDAVADRHEAYGKLLAGLARQVVTTRSGKDARQLLRDGEFGAMLVNMDGADGARSDLWDLASSALRSSDTPVIVIAEGQPDVGDAGATIDYVPTEFLSELLAQRVSCVLELRRLRVERTGDEARIAALETQVHDLGAAVLEEKQISGALRRKVGEQAHRSKNLLAILQSVAMRTVSDGRSIPEARAALMGRFRSLARSHQLASSADGVGVEIAEAVEAELADIADRVAVSGPSARLTASVAQTFMLALHELAANAAQYGALRTDEGAVTLGWTFFEYGADRYLEVVWREHGGMPPQAPPQYGFGLALVSSFAATRADTPSISFEGEGIVCRMRLSQDAIVAG
ncbi:sensor histidine kinase [Hyphomicrobium sp. CS1GBMeth3]|uniref:sensor histidine kinase n=1 Tax=Hyphomicrobium sp. CS1GBMeth3 TaxID=1892845 RepID=UPI0009316020|nr:sensor histidine kinase [Hyphomicrobium sp. CS1GBMeth3]